MSTDGGATWSSSMTIGHGGVGNGSTCRAFAVAPSNSACLYAGGSAKYFVKICSNTGGNWIDVTNGLSTFHTEFDSIFAIWIAPENHDSLLVGTSKGVFASADGGTTWLATPLAFGTVDFAYHPDTDVLYAATQENGVFASDDRGGTWQDISSGLSAMMEIDCIEIDTKNDFLFVGTEGGAWRLNLSDSLLQVDAAEVSAGTGGVCNFALTAGGAQAYRDYLLCGSVSGTDPGTLLPGGLVTIPLNRDWFTGFILSHLNSQNFVDFAGALDAGGNATATLDTLGPIPPVLPVGTVMHFAFALRDSWDFVSNAVAIEVIP